MYTKRPPRAATPADAEAVKAAQEATPARLVMIALDDQGGYHVSTQGVDTLSVPTLLRLAARQVESSLGLE